MSVNSSSMYIICLSYIPYDRYLANLDFWIVYLLMVEEFDNIYNKRDGKKMRQTKNIDVLK